MMFSEYFQVGDLVYASADLLSDGHVPDTAAGDILVPKHTRGMVIEIGHVYLVRFEGADRELGPALGCLKEELTQRV